MLRLSEQAAKQMGLDKTAQEIKASKAELRAQKKAEELAAKQAKREEQAARRAQIKAERASAISADHALHEALDALDNLEESQSEQTKKRAEQHLAEATSEHDKLVREVLALRAKLAKSRENRKQAFDVLTRARQRYEKTVVDASASLVAAKALVQQRWDESEASWSNMPKMFTKENRDRVTRRDAKRRLGISQPRT